jgi:hypothetical protein
MTVEKQSFLQPKAARVPAPNNATNVVATLKRNYKSRAILRRLQAITIRCVSSPTDAKCDAPGAKRRRVWNGRRY